MLKRPEEILEQRTQERALFIETTKQQIAGELEAKYRGEPIEIHFDGTRAEYNEILPELGRFCEKSGWHIRLKTGDLGGGIDFRLSAIKYPIKAEAEAA